MSRPAPAHPGVWQVGAVTITKVVEGEYLLPPEMMLPDASRERLRELDWLSSRHVDARGRIRFSVHALVVATPRRCIVVDTCIGNHKQDRDATPWNGLQTDFLRRLEQAGYPAERIDTVLCTHLHLDHVGWNTTLVEGSWRPTFPNARHLISRREMDHWQARSGEDRETRAVLADSIQPVVDSGQVEWIEPPHQVCEEVRLFPTRGHTPGHVSVEVLSRGARAIISGDVLHHPCQLAHPEWNARPDFDPELASQTRREVLAACSRDGTLLVGTHFADPSAGQVRVDGSAYRFDAPDADAPDPEPSH